MTDRRFAYLFSACSRRLELLGSGCRGARGEPSDRRAGSHTRSIGGGVVHLRWRCRLKKSQQGTDSVASTVDRLRTLTVADLMSKAVTTVSANQTMGEAARTLAEREVSGAPVVDEAGKCVGLLSAHDFVRLERAREMEDGRLPAGATSHRLVKDRPEGPYRVEDLGGDRVTTYMSPAIQTIDARATLLEAARRMCAQHVHRLPVLDVQGRPLGMVTSLDLVAAIVNAVEEESIGARPRT